MKNRSYFYSIAIVSIILLVNCTKKLEDIVLEGYKMNLLETKINSNTREINVLFNVVNEKNEGVSNLTTDNFIVYENENLIDAEGDLNVSNTNSDIEIRTVLLLDNSSSIKQYIKVLKSGAITFINNKFDNHKISIFTFDKIETKKCGFISNKTLLINTINSIPETNFENSTNLYGAILNIITDKHFEWKDNVSATSGIKYNLVVFTDGRHNADPGISTTSISANNNNKSIYVVALKTEELDQKNLRIIGKSGYYEANTIEELNSSFNNAIDDINNSVSSIYSLKYISPISVGIERTNMVRISIKDNNIKSSVIITYFNSKGFQ